MGNIFTAGLFRQMFRSATPVALAAMGGAMTEHAGIMNIGMDGMILMGAFTAVAVMPSPISAEMMGSILFTPSISSASILKLSFIIMIFLSWRLENPFSSPPSYMFLCLKTVDERI